MKKLQYNPEVSSTIKISSEIFPGESCQILPAFKIDLTETLPLKKKEFNKSRTRYYLDQIQNQYN